MPAYTPACLSGKSKFKFTLIKDKSNMSSPLLLGLLPINIWHLQRNLGLFLEFKNHMWQMITSTDLLALHK